MYMNGESGLKGMDIRKDGGGSTSTVFLIEERRCS